MFKANSFSEFREKFTDFINTQIEGIKLFTSMEEVKKISKDKSSPRKTPRLFRASKDKIETDVDPKKNIVHRPKMQLFILETLKSSAASDDFSEIIGKIEAAMLVIEESYEDNILFLPFDELHTQLQYYVEKLKWLSEQTVIKSSKSTYHLHMHRREQTMRSSNTIFNIAKALEKLPKEYASKVLKEYKLPYPNTQQTILTFTRNSGGHGFNVNGAMIDDSVSGQAELADFFRQQGISDYFIENLLKYFNPDGYQFYAEKIKTDFVAHGLAFSAGAKTTYTFTESAKQRSRLEIKCDSCYSGEAVFCNGEFVLENDLYLSSLLILVKTSGGGIIIDSLEYAIEGIEHVKDAKAQGFLKDFFGIMLDAMDDGLDDESTSTNAPSMNGS